MGSDQLGNLFCCQPYVVVDFSPRHKFHSCIISMNLIVNFFFFGRLLDQQLNSNKYQNSYQIRAHTRMVVQIIHLL